MNRKDVIYLVLAAAIFIATGLIAYSQLGGNKGGGRRATVEIVTPISPDYDTDALGVLGDQGKARDFTQPIDLNSGLGNEQPFGAL